MKLFNCIVTGLVVGLVSTWILAIYLASQGEIGLFGAFLMIFGYSIGPIMLAVFLFVVVKKHIASKYKLLSYLAQTGIVSGIIVVGACLMTDHNYRGYMPAILLDCLLISPVYFGVSKFTSSL